MAIDPTKASGAQTPLTGPRLDQAAGNQAARQTGAVRGDGAAPARERPEGADQVELSEAARNSRPAAGTSASGLETERLQEIVKRVTSGFYDSPQVVDKVARKVAGDLGGGTPA